MSNDSVVVLYESRKSGKEKVKIEKKKVKIEKEEKFSNIMNDDSVIMIKENFKESVALSPFARSSKAIRSFTPRNTVVTKRMVDATTSITPNRFEACSPSTISEKDFSEDYSKLLDKTCKNLEESPLRPIVIDGSNVAMTHGCACFDNTHWKTFSCRGILIAVEHFLKKGHKNVTAIVPSCRKNFSQHDGVRVADKIIFNKLEKNKHLIFTPSKVTRGKTVVCYDDRFIIELAAKTKGVVVSNDHYRDLKNETSDKDWLETIEKRLLQYVFAKDIFMIPEDPLGRRGPSLKNFLSFHNVREERFDGRKHTRKRPISEQPGCSEKKLDERKTPRTYIHQGFSYNYEKKNFDVDERKIPRTYIHQGFSYNYERNNVSSVYQYPSFRNGRNHTDDGFYKNEYGYQRF